MDELLKYLEFLKFKKTYNIDYYSYNLMFDDKKYKIIIMSHLIIFSCVEVEEFWGKGNDIKTIDFIKNYKPLLSYQRKIKIDKILNG